MPIEPPHLDDRSFQDIVDETKRLIPRFTPEWTNHNVADPGVALIELFAWMSETVLYRVNQVPDRMYVHFLNLVGIEPFPPSVAHAPLTFLLSGPASPAVVVPEGTEVATDSGSDEPVVFSTVRDVTVERPDLVAAHAVAAGSDIVSDAWEALTVEGLSAPTFLSVPPRPDDAFYLGTSRSLAGYVVQLDVSARAEGVGIDPDVPPLVWEAWDGTAWAPARVRSGDTTGGLNRDGSFQLDVPARHEPLALAGTVAHWLRVRLLRPAPGRPGYETTPRIASVRLHAVGVTVPGEHASRAPGELVGRSTGVPAQTFTVTRFPVAARRPDEGVLVDGTPWQEVEDFSASGPEDEHVVWTSSTGEVRFGPAVRYPDGTVRQHGAVPPDGARVSVTPYRWGGGARGNVGAGTLNRVRTPVPSVESASNPTRATGGVDAETAAEAKVRGPLTLRTGGRAVTPSDFEQVARQASVEVARVRCLPAADGPVVRLLVVPEVRSGPEIHRIDDFALGDALFERISTAVDAQRLVGVAVEVGTPFYQGISVAALVRSVAGRPADVVQQRVHATLDRFVHPLHGGTDGTGWPFDRTLTVTAFTQAVEAVDGVLAVDELQIFEYDLRTGRRLGEGQESVRLAADALFLGAAHRVVVR